MAEIIVINRRDRSPGKKAKKPPEPKPVPKYQIFPAPFRPDPKPVSLALSEVWGDRLVAHPEKGYVLDGRPVALDYLMLETNRVLKSWGMEQVGKKKEWLA